MQEFQPQPQPADGHHKDEEDSGACTQWAGYLLCCEMILGMTPMNRQVETPYKLSEA